MATFPGIQGNEMDDETARAFLREQGFGVLSLASNGEAYGIPISYGYDVEAERLYFVFLRPGERSKKKRFGEATERASFLTFDVPSREEWRTVIATGTLRIVDDDEWSAVSAALEDNAWFPTLFSETEPMQDLVGWALDIEDVTGMHSRTAR
ncbi:pyridoxamine 5'-phosphate oxidase family protein [Salinigranum marinum]|uniref:pyridoxamine 5'-phosphate oxidase family protein n=1 Tax=Salinigranum marinum TaxID=1515595 RepID=UPI002989D8F9|nr:pyridoxamine 5'-phosphate oxidase family protein [Salinigranum marinum]